MKIVETGKELLLSFELSTEDEILDGAPEGSPLRLKVGSGRLHPRIEALLLNKTEGEELHIHLDSSLAFGEIKPDLVIRVARKKLPQSLSSAQVGLSFETLGPDSKPCIFRITEASDNWVVMDANHPLAGKDLELKAKIIQIF